MGTLGLKVWVRRTGMSVILLVWQVGWKVSGKHTGCYCLDLYTLCATACPISSKQMRYNLHHGLTAPCIYLHSAIVYLYFNCLLTCQLPTRQSPLEDRESLFILHPPTLLSHEAIWEMYFWTNMLLTPSADSENMWENPDNLKMWYSQESPNRYTETYLN